LSAKLVQLLLLQVQLLRKTSRGLQRFCILLQSLLLHSDLLVQLLLSVALVLNALLLQPTFALHSLLVLCIN
jgi:hypothetical protein